jgi:hypothetical protein
MSKPISQVIIPEINYRALSTSSPCTAMLLLVAAEIHKTVIRFH